MTDNKPDESDLSEIPPNPALRRGMKISAKLAAGFGILVMLTLAVVALNYFGGDKANATIERTHKQRIPMMLATSHARADILKMLGDVRGYLVTGEPRFLTIYHQSKKDFLAAMERSEMLAPKLDPEKKRRYSEFRKIFEKWVAFSDRLFKLRDNKMMREPAYSWLNTDGLKLIGGIIANVKQLIVAFGELTPSVQNRHLLKDMHELLGSFTEIYSSLRILVATGNSNYRFEYNANRSINNNIWNHFIIHAESLQPRQRKILNLISRSRERLWSRIDENVLAILDSDKWRKDLYLFRTEAAPLAEAMQRLLGEMAADSRNLFENDMKNGAQGLAFFRYLTLAGGIAALILGISLSFLLGRNIVKPLHNLTNAAEKFRKGHSDIKARIKSHDEIGVLAATFNRMTGRIRQTMDNLQAANSNLQHEIKERELVEKELRENKEWFQTTLRSIGDAIIATDTKGDVTFMNPVAESLTGWNQEEARGRPLEDIFNIINEETREPVESPVQKVIREERVIGLANHTLLIAKNGTEIPIDDSGAPIRDEKGNIAGVVLAFRDVREKKKAKHALRESETKYRIMMEAMQDPVYICSSDCNVEYMNPAMIKRTGRNAIGESCFKTIYDLDVQCAWCMHDRVQQGEYCEDDIISPKDNRSYHVSHSPIIHADGSVSMLTLFKDTTDLLKMETQLRQAQKMEAIGNLAGGIAHDFNNILFPIVAYTELMLPEAPEDSLLRERLNRVLNAAMRARDLVKQILTFSRQKEQALRPLQIQLVLREALKLIHATLPSTIEIVQKIDKQCGMVMADPTQIHQVVMNLITNAHHAMEETGGKLNVTLKEIELKAEAIKKIAVSPGLYACITVADTGIGMDQSVTERIFDPYFTTKEEDKGTGLGLAVVHGIVASYEGHINVYSEPGAGTEFQVCLPIIRKQGATGGVKASVPLKKGNESVLLVDDQEDVISLLKEILVTLGYRVTAYTGSLEALEAFRTNPDSFDIVLTDMTMPKMTGNILAQKIMAIKPDMPVILCTGFSERISDENALALGVKGFLMKMRWHWVLKVF